MNPVAPNRTASSESQTARPSLLVCAPRPGSDPAVVVAHGSFEQGQDRVFWLDGPETEVLRIPVDAPVSQRPLHAHAPAVAATGGEAALTRAVQRHVARALPAPRPAQDQAPSQSSPDGAQPLASLCAALRAGDRTAACAQAELVRSSSSLAQVHDAIVATLVELGDQWAAGTSTIMAERRASSAAQAVIRQLEQATTPPPNDSCIVLATPPGDRHRLGLELLAQLLAANGRTALVVEDLPLHELTALAKTASVAAVVVSAHLPLPLTLARRMVTAIRTAAPDVLIALGGPGFIETGTDRGSGADLVSSRPDDLLRALSRHGGPLTSREHEVLIAVADGLTNRQIADRLDISQATVKSHLDRVLTKTRTEHRAGAVARALREGWIT